jgi:S1-C subfamily serine protease
MAFANVEKFSILYFSQAGSGFPAPWCVVPNLHVPGGNPVLCVYTQADAQGLIDALATLVVASGGDLAPDEGIDSTNSLLPKFVKKYPNESGATINGVTGGSPAAQAGIQAGDILHAVNGKPYLFGQGMVYSAVLEAAWHKPSGGVVHVEIFRNHVPMSIDIHLAKAQVNVEKLQREGAEMVQQAGASAAGPAPGPAEQPSGLKFGFQVRAVTDADVIPFGLASAKGIVVADVLRGGLADTMGFKPGDVILAVNDSEIGDLEFFTQFIHSSAVKKFKVWRKGQSLELIIPQYL